MASVDDILSNAIRAAGLFSRLDQEKTDHIVEAVFRAAFDARVSLARMAHEETTIGVWQHKVIKNVIATQLVYEDIRYERTVGVIREDRTAGITEMAVPLGPVLALIPVTNPTSTVLFKILIALKTRNPLIISPHRAAKKSTCEAARICYEAATAAGAPEHCIQWMEKASPQKIEDLMNHPRLKAILATGTGSLVRQAFRTGTPTIGVGPGNVPVYIGESADVPYAVNCILASKTFDHGSVCASEQALIIKHVIADRVLSELRRHKAHMCTREQTEQLSAIAWDPERRTMTPQVVGQSAVSIAGKAGFEVPEDTSVLVAELRDVGPSAPLSAEILAPILAFYVEEDFESAIRRCVEVTNFGGRGHTAAIFSNDEEKTKYFCNQVNAARLLVNMPATQGALGGIYNTLRPSFTLGCGSAANNTTTDNITARHLLNIHRISRRRPNEQWFALGEEAFLDESLTAEKLEETYNRNF